MLMVVALSYARNPSRKFPCFGELQFQAPFLGLEAAGGD